MSNIFRSRESMAQDEAMNAYASTLGKITEENREAAEKVNDFNERLGSIVDPIGGAILTKPIETTVKAGFRKALGYGAKKVEQKITGKLSELVNGDSEYMNKLPSNVQRGLKAVLQDNPELDVKNGFRQLSSKAQDTINSARQRLGKSKLSATEETTTPASEPTSTVADSPPDNPVSTANSAVESEPLEAVESEANSTLRRFNALPEESRADLAQQYRDNPLRVENPSTAEDFRTNLNLRQQAVQQEEERLGQGQRPTPTDEPSQAPGSDAPTTETPQQVDFMGDRAGREGTALRSSGSDPQQASESGANADPDNAGLNSVNNTDTSVANVNAAETSASEGGADAVSGLSDAADALDAISAAQGGADIFTDILAGIVGLATIIGGSAGKKSVPVNTATPISSGIQFGV